MNESIDIKKQLEVKNKEIYINKLNHDLDNNLEVLVLTIDNLLSFITNETTKRILEINGNHELFKSLEISSSSTKLLSLLVGI